ncbi:MAG: HlyC/CorC family transporter, partial [Cyanobacteria bacterium J06649_11]
GEIVDETDKTIDLQAIARKKRERMLQSMRFAYRSVENKR